MNDKDRKKAKKLKAIESDDEDEDEGKISIYLGRWCQFYKIYQVNKSILYFLREINNRVCYRGRGKNQGRTAGPH